MLINMKDYFFRIRFQDSAILEQLSARADDNSGRKGRRVFRRKSERRHQSQVLLNNYFLII